jgi:hypothetical protein
LFCHGLDFKVRRKLARAQPILSIASAGEESKLNVPTKLGIARETTGRNYVRIYAHDEDSTRS